MLIFCFINVFIPYLQSLLDFRMSGVGTINFFFFFRICILFSLSLSLIGGQLLYNIVLISAIHQHESATGVHMSPPSWTPLPSPTPSHPSRLSQSPGLSSLCHTIIPHLLSAFAQQKKQKQDWKTTLRMGENNCKWNNWQRINLPNI